MTTKLMMTEWLSLASILKAQIQGKTVSVRILGNPVGKLVLLFPFDFGGFPPHCPIASLSGSQLFNPPTCRLNLHVVMHPGAGLLLFMILLHTIPHSPWAVSNPLNSSRDGDLSL